MQRGGPPSQARLLRADAITRRVRRRWLPAGRVVVAQEDGSGSAQAQKRAQTASNQRHIAPASVAPARLQAPGSKRRRVFGRLCDSGHAAFGRASPSSDASFTLLSCLALLAFLTDLFPFHIDIWSCSLFFARSLVFYSSLSTEVPDKARLLYAIHCYCSIFTCYHPQTSHQGVPFCPLEPPASNCTLAAIIRTEELLL
jgi:hypothetical protein